MKFLFRRTQHYAELSLHQILWAVQRNVPNLGYRISSHHFKLWIMFWHLDVDVWNPKSKSTPSLPELHREVAATPSSGWVVLQYIPLPSLLLFGLSSTANFSLTKECLERLFLHNTIAATCSFTWTYCFLFQQGRIVEVYLLLILAACFQNTDSQVA